MSSSKGSHGSERSGAAHVTAVVLEDIRAQNKVVLEAVHGLGQKVERDLQQLRSELVARLLRLEDAAREHSRDLRDVKEALVGKVDEASFVALERRVAELERKVGGR